MDQSKNQLTNQSMDQSINGSINHLIDQSIHPSPQTKILSLSNLPLFSILNSLEICVWSCTRNHLYHSKSFFGHMSLNKFLTRSVAKSTRAANYRKICPLTPSCNHPRNFIAKASIVMEICTGQNSSMKINKGQ